METSGCPTAASDCPPTEASTEGPALFLLDGGSLKGPGSPAEAGWARPWVPPTHHLDTPERLVTCYQLVHTRRPEARILVFLETGGYSRLCLEWQGGSCRALEPANAQCVPFGCRVGDFLLEFAKRKAVEGCNVVVVSNTADIVVGCRNAGARLSHLGFMFVEGDILMPGLTAARPSANGAAVEEEQSVSAAASGAAASGEDAPRPTAAPKANVVPVRRTITKSGAAAPQAARRRPPGALRGRTVSRVNLASDGPEDTEREETLRDSQLDGVALDDPEAPETLVDEADEAFADTMVDLPYREMDLASDEAFAETLADADRRAAASAASAAVERAREALQRQLSQEDIELAQAATVPMEDVELAAAPTEEARPEALRSSQSFADGQQEEATMPTIPAETPMDAVVADEYAALSQTRLLEEREEPEHQSQLPEIQSSPDLEVEAVARRWLLDMQRNSQSQEEPAFSQTASQPAAALPPPCSPTAPPPSQTCNSSQVAPQGSPRSGRGRSRSPRANRGRSQTIDLGASRDNLEPVPAEPAGGCCAPDVNEAVVTEENSSLIRQATQVVLPESITAPHQEPAAKGGEAASAPMELEPAAAQESLAVTEAMSQRGATAAVSRSGEVVQTPSPDAAAGAPKDEGLAPEATMSVPADCCPAPAQRAKDVEVECVEVEPPSSLDPTVQLGSQAPTQPAKQPVPPAPREPEIEASALLGRWARDGGREHVVVWSSNVLGPFLEFRPADKNKRALPIQPEGGAWLLNGFYLDASRSTAGRLQWTNASTGAERTWWRPESPGATKESTGNADAVSTLAGSFSGELGGR